MGVHLKASLLFTGYGGSVTDQASPAEQQAAQGVSFENPYEVMEQNTSATKQFAADLKSAGVEGLPTQAEYDGYEAVGLLLQGLEAAGSNPTQASAHRLPFQDPQLGRFGYVGRSHPGHKQPDQHHRWGGQLHLGRKVGGQAFCRGSGGSPALREGHPRRVRVAAHLIHDM